MCRSPPSATIHAQREADALREQLEALQAAQPTLTRRKRPRGRARRLLLGRAEGRLVRRERQAVRARRPPRKEAACSVAAERTAALQETKQELTQTFRSLYPNAAHSTPGTPTIHTYYTYYTSYTPTTPGYGITPLIPPAKAV